MAGKQSMVTPFPKMCLLAPSGVVTFLLRKELTEGRRGNEEGRVALVWGGERTIYGAVMMKRSGAGVSLAYFSGKGMELLPGLLQTSFSPGPGLAPLMWPRLGRLSPSYGPKWLIS